MPAESLPRAAPLPGCPPALCPGRGGLAPGSGPGRRPAHGSARAGAAAGRFGSRLLGPRAARAERGDVDPPGSRRLGRPGALALTFPRRVVAGRGGRGSGHLPASLDRARHDAPGRPRARRTLVLALRPHAGGGAHPGSGAGSRRPRGRRARRGARGPSAFLAGSASSRRSGGGGGLLRHLPRLRPPQPRLGPPVGQPSRQRAQVPPHGGGSRTSPEPRRGARERIPRRAAAAAAGACRPRAPRPPSFASRRGHDRRSRAGAAGGGPRGHPRHPDHAADRGREGRRRLPRARSRSFPPAGSHPAGGSGPEPPPGHARTSRGLRAPNECAGRAAGDGRLPAGTGRDRTPGPGGDAGLRVRAPAALPLLLLPVLPRDARGAGLRGGRPRCSSCASG